LLVIENGGGRLYANYGDETIRPARIPLKAISHSGGKPITVPEGNRSGVGVKDAGSSRLPRLIGIVSTQ
jgi:hypothetical protein